MNRVSILRSAHLAHMTYSILCTGYKVYVEGAFTHTVQTALLT